MTEIETTGSPLGQPTITFELVAPREPSGRAPLANAGDYFDLPADTSDALLLHLWLAEHPNRHTKKQYAQRVEEFFAWMAKPLQAIQSADLIAWRASLATDPNPRTSAPRSANTQKVTIKAIKSLFSFAHDLGYLRYNPAVRLKAPNAPPQHHTKALSELEIELMIHHTKKHRTKLIIRTLYVSACRVAELCALRWQDFGQLPNGEGFLVVSAGKGDKYRQVGLTKKTTTILADWRTHNSALAPHAPIFPSYTGKPMDPATVHAIIKGAAVRALGQAKGAPVSPHWLRHSHATNALASGRATLAEVQAQLGHASITTTGIYVHPSKSSAQALGL